MGATGSSAGAGAATGVAGAVMDAAAYGAEAPSFPNSLSSSGLMLAI